MYIIIIYVHLFILQGWHGVGVQSIKLMKVDKA